MSRRLFLSFFLLSACAWAKPPADTERNELPAPFNLQAVVLQKTITLTWQWPRPEELPAFTQLGYEVKRSDGKTFQVNGTSYADSNLLPSSYTYVVRVRGVAKEKGKKVTYVSDWSEPAAGVVKTSCAGPPTIQLSVEQTQKTYSSVTALRFHLKGLASVDGSCQLGSVKYHLDSGTGIAHGGPLPVDSKGRFDTFINAFGPDDEIPSGHVSFAISATAENEAGPTTSDVYSVDVDLQNPFAPH
jgi:hypothetical protein